MIIHEPAGKRRAKALLPYITIGVEKLIDIPSLFGSIVQPNDMRPIFHYRMMRQCDHDILLLTFYSKRDWTGIVPFRLLGIDEHEHDHEGLLIMKERIDNDRHKWRILTVAHHELHYKEIETFTKPTVYRESATHAVYPFYKQLINPMIVTDPQLINFDNYKQEELDGWTKIFNSHNVNMPWQWHVPYQQGCFWNDPFTLLEWAKRRLK